MYKNYLKIAFRNLARNKAFSFINIFGLAVSLAVCLLILVYILDETSYDKHHVDAERIYRISTVSGQGESWAAVGAPIAFAAKNDFPEVEQVTRLLKFPNMDKVLLQYEHKNESRQFIESNGYYVDSTFFQLFTYDFKYGDATTALNQPNSLVVSESIADKLFGHEDPVGKPVTIGLPFGEFQYTVQGVFRNTNHKSHIPAHFFLSMRNRDIGTWVEVQNNWATNSIFHTYIKLKKGTDARNFEPKLKPFMNRHGSEDLKAAGISKSLFIQPLKDIYLHPSTGYEIGSTGNTRYLYILGSIAVFILIIACINFMNLSTARSEKRTKEVGVRKVMGAQKGSLVLQFLGESFLMCLIALLLALMLARLLLPLFNNLTQKDLQPFNDPSLLFWLAGLTLLTGLLSGLYPAFYLSSFKPVSIIKGKLFNHFSATAIRKGLVVFQFTVSVSLILGVIVIWQQINLLKNQPLGFNKNMQIILPLQSSEAITNYPVLKNELLKNPDIKTVTSGSTYPGIENVNDMLFYAEGKTVNEFVDIHTATIENDYFKTLGFTMLQGRPFSKDFKADSASIILNESAIRELGYDVETAVGKKIHYDLRGEHNTIEITGIVKDFNFESLHNPIRPFGFLVSGFFGNKYNYLIANIKTANYTRLLADVEKSWAAINPSVPFEYSFLDQDFQKNYEKEQRTARIVIYFTIVAILIACLGLFGLVTFATERRTKEIGIRKVLGASVTNVTTLLSKDFMLLVVIAILIASPIAWYGMNKWLQNFAYKIEISWWMFMTAGLIVVFIALITVCFQSVKAALSNPVRSLRTE